MNQVSSVGHSAETTRLLDGSTKPVVSGVWCMTERSVCAAAFQPTSMSIEGATSRLLLVDSGRFAHVCPEDFANHIPLRSPPSDVQARCANGRELVSSRKVPVIPWGGQRADLKFLVMNIAKPLLSVSQLEGAGYHVHFGGSACDRYIEHPNGSSGSLRKLGRQSLLLASSFCNRPLF